jgi:RloB-like protein
MRRRKRSYDRRVSRTAPTALSEGKTFLIVVEGKETERLYFDGLRKRLGLKATDVVVEHAGATDPGNMVMSAAATRDRRAEEAKRSVLLTPYDEVWIVFDREAQHHPRGKQISAALAKAAIRAVLVAVSNPAFEFWLLLHFGFTTKSFEDAKAVSRELRKHLPKYKKNDFPAEILFPLLAQAVTNAAACLSHHKTSAGDGNPSTQVHLLASSLNASAAPVFRLI